MDTREIPESNRLHVASTEPYCCHLHIATKDRRRTALPQARRSGCPINLTLEQLGDRWSLIVIRDVTFGNRRSYGELLAQSEEGIASNILADRLKRLTASGLLTRRPDPD